MTASIFNGTLPALMTPCKEDRTPDFDALVRKAQQLLDHGMTAMIYAGSMGDWPLLTDAERVQDFGRWPQGAHRPPLGRSARQVRV